MLEKVAVSTFTGERGKEEVSGGEWWRGKGGKGRGNGGRGRV